MTLERVEPVLRELGQQEDEIFRLRRDREERDRSRDMARQAGERYRRQAERVDMRLGWAPPVALPVFLHPSLPYMLPPISSLFIGPGLSLPFGQIEQGKMENLEHLKHGFQF